MLEALGCGVKAKAEGYVGKVAELVGLGGWLPEQVKDKVEDTEYDLLIVGGGATGAGVALDAASRGLKVAVVERDDFSSGTIISYKVYILVF